jgi:hypothetical protein
MELFWKLRKLPPISASQARFLRVWWLRWNFFSNIVFVPVNVPGLMDILLVAPEKVYCSQIGWMSGPRDIWFRETIGKFIRYKKLGRVIFGKINSRIQTLGLIIYL